MQHTPVSQSTFLNTVSTTTQSVYSTHFQAPITGSAGSQWQAFGVTSCSPTSLTTHLEPKPEAQYTATSDLPLGNVTQQYPVSHWGQMALRTGHYMQSPASFADGGLQHLHNQSGSRLPTADNTHPVSSGSGLHARRAISTMIDAESNTMEADSNTMIADSNTNTPGIQDMPIPGISGVRKRRKQRISYTQAQKHELETFFINTNWYPKAAEKTALAQRTGLSVRQVKVWFQNRRMKAKKLLLSEPAMPGATLSTPQSAAGTRFVQFQKPVLSAYSTSAAEGSSWPSSGAVSSDSL